jgi:hypothetical protein
VLAYTPPRDGLDLVWRIWMTMEWSRTWQVVTSLLVLSTGAGLLAHIVGASAVWSASGGMIAAAGTGLATYNVARRRRRRLNRRGRRSSQPNP